MRRSIFRRVRLSAGVRMAAIVVALALSAFSAVRVLSAPMSTVVTVPDRVGFEGFLVDDATGSPLEGTHTLFFTVYDAATGGVVKWTEEHQGVEVTDGFYAVELGAYTSLAADTFDGDRWIGLAVDGGAEMTPRTRISSVPFALTADTVDGRHASDLEVPAGVVVMWSGAIVDVPAGWALCDGTNGTPDLRDRFIVGAGSSYSPGDAGGSATSAHTHAIASGGGHSHVVNPPSTQSAGNGGTVRKDGYQTAGNDISSNGHKHWLDIPAFNSGSAGSHNHGGATGGASDEENRPPYYALAYIIKLSE